MRRRACQFPKGRCGGPEGGGLWSGALRGHMANYDVNAALDELKEDAVLPHPVRLRDLILRARLDPEAALEINREFQSYLTRFGELQKVATTILEKLALSQPKSA